MKKATLSLSIGSMAVYGLSFFMLILAILFQSKLVPLLFGVNEQTFVFPVSQVVSVGSMLGFSIGAFPSSINGKPSLSTNIVLTVLPLLLITPLSMVLSNIQSTLIMRMFDATVSMSWSHVNALASWASCLNFLAYGAYMVCGGIRIAYAAIHKHNQREMVFPDSL